MNEAKIRLSQKEMDLITDTDLILTKNSVLQKVLELLGNVSIRQRNYLQHHPQQLPAEVAGTSPKISKGENYKGLPYYVLDFPRCFEKDDIFAIRTMFWWGHFFSVTLHLSGSYKKKYQERIIASYELIRDNDFYYCINDGAWEHHFEESNYTLLQTIQLPELEAGTQKRSFIKLAQKFSLLRWNEAEELLTVSFEQMMGILTGQLPRR